MVKNQNKSGIILICLKWKQKYVNLNYKWINIYIYNVSNHLYVQAIFYALQSPFFEKNKKV